MRALLALVVSLSACEAQQKPVRASTCATPGATYVVHYEERSGACGPRPDETFSVTPDGYIAKDPPDCIRVELDGCSVESDDCTLTWKGTCSLTSVVTYADDGTIGSGAATITCTGIGQDCVSGYAMTIQRQ
jgi:hypothetical protein